MVTMVPRAERVDVPVPIMYRLRGGDYWVHSRLLNISESGVLFGPTELAPGTPVEVILSFPLQVGALAPGKQVCVARAVRTTGGGAVAARFAECRFLLEE